MNLMGTLATHGPAIEGWAKAPRRRGHDLALLLAQIAELDPSAPEHASDANYADRNALVIRALGAALAAGLPAGVYFDAAAPGWPVAAIELPQGQCSWHLPAHTTPWDRHTVEDKYARIAAFVAATVGEDR